VPALARRGRTTLRHFILLLFGGYSAWVVERRERGARGLIFSFHRVAAWTCWRFIDPEIASLPFPAQLRRRLEILGPTYIKLGQILSLRLDILPEVVTAELRGLLSNLPPVPFDAIVEVIEADLGCSLESLFLEIDPEPMGSASIAQSHRALTVPGDRVLLKVVKPGIRELLFRDMELLRLVGVALEVMVPSYQPRRIIDEFCDYTLREADMVQEAQNARSFQNNFVDMPEIVFPAIYTELSGTDVLCMEYLEGVEPSSDVVAALTLDDRRRLIDLGATAIIRMLYEDGFFHADLHPGNLLILPDQRIGFIDLGMVGEIDPALRHSLMNLYHSLVMENFDSAGRYLADVAYAERGADVVAFRRAVRELSRRWRRDATFENFSLALLILEATRLGARYKLYFPVEMVLMVKALVTYEGVGYMLDKDFNVAEVSARHIGRIFRQQFSPRQLLAEVRQLAPELLDAATRMPALVSESLRYLEQQTRQQPVRPFRGLRSTILGGFCLVSAAILIAFGGPWPMWAALLALGVLLPLRRGE
jgi:ubiquinone biosynthesis protein